MKPPSTAFREDVTPDEAERYQRYADQLLALQKAKSKELGAGRVLHRKCILALRARFDVLGGLPAHARHGLFTTPGSHDAWVRLSNGSMNRQPDRVPDIRGFGIKVFGVKGESALGGPATSQGFALINQPAFSSAKSEPFVELVTAVASGPFALVRHFIKTYGWLGGLAQMRRLVRALRKPFSGFATEPFYSAAPLASGPYAVRVRLLPASPGSLSGARDWAADMRARLAAGPVSYDFQLQFFVDEATTPIEDASVDWSEAEAPYVTVARLTLPSQSFDTDDARDFAKEVEATAFDPWCALAEHRPLGDVMRARKVVYYASQKSRGVA